MTTITAAKETLDAVTAATKYDVGDAGHRLRP
jgi:hypothetical protein